MFALTRQCRVPLQRFDRHAGGAHAYHKGEPPQVVIAIAAVAAACPLNRRRQAGAFIVAQRILGKIQPSRHLGNREAIFGVNHLAILELGVHSKSIAIPIGPPPAYSATLTSP